ncbi:lysis protein [Xenorhabdus sp. PB61.4]|uniref:lysis protein n=1 Tax=Xenorhabdus sp. PB61.4 TaxID=2788940 RepID=UPI001E3CEC95|nr:lysis protein [Xenorhabdus sp. PB61.4]MCC8368446.1 lysis protein [Xenorhabdus sp. PB61.4]
MKINSQLFIVGAMTLLSTLLCLTYWQYQKKVKDYTELNEKYQAQVIATKQQQERIQHLSELDRVHTQELANAKTEIDTLRADVAAGRRKLRIKATCPVSEATSSGSVGGAETPQLTEPAKQDYYDLLRMMVENERQTKYLQDYVNTECRGNDGKSTP